MVLKLPQCGSSILNRNCYKSRNCHSMLYKFPFHVYKLLIQKAVLFWLSMSLMFLVFRIYIEKFIKIFHFVILKLWWPICLFFTMFIHLCVLHYGCWYFVYLLCCSAAMRAKFQLDSCRCVTTNLQSHMLIYMRLEMCTITLKHSTNYNWKTRSMSIV